MELLIKNSVILVFAVSLLFIPVWIATAACITTTEGKIECTDGSDPPEGSRNCQQTGTAVICDPPAGNGEVGGEGGGGRGIVIPSPFVGTIIDVLDRIIGFLLAIAVPIATIMVLYGAFQMLTAGGKAEQFMKGNKTIMYAAIGFAIVLIGRGVISLVRQLITGS